MSVVEPAHDRPSRSFRADDIELELVNWKRLQNRFDEDDSIENYVALRRAYPGCDTEIHRLAEVDPLNSETFGLELDRAGIARTLVIGALGGDSHEIDELNLQLMEKLIERRKLEKEGLTHLQSRGYVVSDCLLGHLIVAILEILQQDGLEPMPSFVVLVREYHGGAKNEILKNHEKCGSRNQGLFLAMQMKRRGEIPTIRRLAETMNVQPSTVSRWFPNGDFLEQVELFTKKFKTFPIGSSDTL